MRAPSSVVADAGLGRALDQQNGLVGDGVGLGTGGIEQFTGALQRNGGVLAQQLVQLRHRCRLFHVLSTFRKSGLFIGRRRSWLDPMPDCSHRLQYTSTSGSRRADHQDSARTPPPRVVAAT